MATQAQIEANQKNARLSTGPRTEEGKDISSRNATTHGMTSKQVVLPHENQEEWETVRDGFIRTWAPANPIEYALAVAVAETWWRLQRQRRIETQLLQQRMQAVCETNPDLEGDAALAFLMTDPAEMKRMNLMLRYVNSAERAHAKAIAELREIQKLRRAAEPDAASPDADLDSKFDGKFDATTEADLERQLEAYMNAKIAAETKPGETPKKIGYSFPSLPERVNLG